MQRKRDTLFSHEAPAPSPAPAPVVVTSFEKIDQGGGNVDCRLNYSDGTNYQWHWQVYSEQASWVTDGQGQNGHWVAGTSYSNKCDSTVVGRLK